MTAIVFARLDGWIQVIFVAVVGGIALINKILEWRRNRHEPPEQSRPALQRRRPQEQANMESKDIDQFLDEVLTGRQARPPQPAARVPDAEVVVLRPNRPPVRQPARQQPPQRGRQTARRQPQPATAGPPPLLASVAPARSDFHAEVQRAVDQAAQAASGAGSLQPSTQPTQRTEAPAPTTSLFTMLRTPTDVRRAFLLSEIFGPPRAFRRPRRS